MNSFQLLDLYLLSNGMMRAQHRHEHKIRSNSYDIRYNEAKQVIFYCSFAYSDLKDRPGYPENTNRIRVFAQKIARKIHGTGSSTDFEDYLLISNLEKSIRWLGKLLLELPIKKSHDSMSYTQLDYIEQYRRIMFDLSYSNEQIDEENLHIYRIVRGCESNIVKPRKFGDGMDGIVRDITKIANSDHGREDIYKVRVSPKKDGNGIE